MLQKLRRVIKDEISIWGIAALPGIALILVVIIARLSGLLQFSEWMFLDTFLRMRPSEPIAKEIVIVGIDEEDLDKINRYPVPDGDIAELIKKISNYQPRIIGLDIFKNIPIEPGNKELRKIFKENKDIIGIEKVLNPNKVKPPSDLDPKQVGFVDIIPDLDGQYRRYLLCTPNPDTPDDVQKDKFSLSLRLAIAYLSANNITLKKDISNCDAIRFGSTELPIFKSNTGGYTKTDAAGIQMLMNFRNGKKRFPVFSLHDVKNNKVPENILRDKIVLIGMTDVTSDLFDTSAISGLEPNRKVKTSLYGVEYHAHATSQIINAVLNGRPLLKTWSDNWEYLWIIIWGCVPIVIGRLAQSVWKNLLAVAASIIFLIGVSYVLLIWCGLWIPVAPSLLILLINGVGLVSSFTLSRRGQVLKYQINEQLRIIESMFDTIHSGPLQRIDNLERNLRTQELPQEEIIFEVHKIGSDVRDIGEYSKQKILNGEENLRLGSGLILNLNEPINQLFHRVYTSTLKRKDLKNLSTIKVKIREFEPIDEKYVNLEDKSKVCQFLEEALCNIGKHAEGTKRLEATGKNHDGYYTLSVKDNGCGIRNSSFTESRGTRECRNIAKKLGGKFKRESISPRGCLCEITWFLVERKNIFQKMQSQLKNRIQKFFI